MTEETPSTNTPPHLSNSIKDTLERLADGQYEGKTIHRSFIIGGASLYYDTLKLPVEGPSFVDRVLITRVLSPDFPDCDVFLPDFERLAEAQGKPFTRAAHKELEEWVGFEVPEGVQEDEKGTRYEFQMWVR